MKMRILAAALVPALIAPVVAQNFNLDRADSTQVLSRLKKTSSTQIAPVLQPISTFVDGRQGNYSAQINWDAGYYPVPGKQSLTTGSVMAHIQIYDEGWKGIGQIAAGRVGPVTISLVRNGQARVIYTAGGEAAAGSELGPMQYLKDTFWFQADVELRDDMGIRAGDVLRAEYQNPSDWNGFPQLIRAESPFVMQDADLRLYFQGAAVLGHPVALTLSDAALNRDSQVAETVDLRAIRFQADGIDTTLANPAFNAHPLLETSRNTAVFNGMITLPVAIDGVPLYPGEKVTFSFADVNPGDAVVPNQKTNVISFDTRVSNSGAAIELDRGWYGPSDMVYIKVTAKDFNFSPDSYDIIGDGSNHNGIITISAGGEKLNSYVLSEAGLETGQGVDAGVFAGRIQLNPNGATGGEGPLLGVLKAAAGQSLTVTFTYDRARQDGTGRETYTASATAQIR